MVSQKPTIEDMHRLEQALSRYGYTRERNHLHMDGSVETHFVAPPRVECVQVKPYHLYISGAGVLEIHHVFSCRQTWGRDTSHEQEFLQELRTVIGKLDAEAHFDPGDSGHGPRLRIYL